MYSNPQDPSLTFDNLSCLPRRSRVRVLGDEHGLLGFDEDDTICFPVMRSIFSCGKSHLWSARDTHFLP